MADAHKLGALSTEAKAVLERLGLVRCKLLRLQRVNQWRSLCREQPMVL